ncbi:hypothetical protein NIES2109_64080 (plasmid) [Nostoc sp. HK-01]|nr:hypothetical protein NIES2109_64080 [Nostoc sp. HK-01]
MPFFRGHSSPDTADTPRLKPLCSTDTSRHRPRHDPDTKCLDGVYRTPIINQSINSYLLLIVLTKGIKRNTVMVVYTGNY